MQTSSSRHQQISTPCNDMGHAMTSRRWCCFWRTMKNQDLSRDKSSKSMEEEVVSILEADTQFKANDEHLVKQLITRKPTITAMHAKLKTTQKEKT
mmetsp:Transcript_28461/g.46738  ORF Transcript_28461/g.46738 Transcript_28461/m.46738 type:complete len:96 (+) Transcript_28461:693-980(+)